ncbi:MAG: hypothetical protein JHC95_11920 [Solirubrobacteraceae bacterium]|nr:hypothetical protein [Solirubrobacteraceae bacterium]
MRPAGILLIVLALAASALGCSVEDDCTTSDTRLASPDGTVVATDRQRSCGGAAGATEGQVLLRLAADPGDGDVVLRANHVNGLRWTDDGTLVVGVDPVDEISDPVREHDDEWATSVADGSDRRVRIVLDRQVLDG